MSNNCLITRLKAVVNDDSLPVVETMQQFTLDAITAGGNKSMTDSQKYALNHFFYQIGAISNSSIWSKAGIVLLPVIGANKNYHLYDYKSNSIIAGTVPAMIDTNGGLELYYGEGDIRNTSFTLSTNIQSLDFTSVGAFTSSVKSRNITNVNGYIFMTNMSFSDSSTAMLDTPNSSVSAGMFARCTRGVDYFQAVNDEYVNSVRSVLININGTPSAGTIKTFFADDGGDLLEKKVANSSGTYAETTGLSVNNISIRFSSGNTYGVYMLFTQALTDDECAKLIQANQDLIEAF
jgi:hypothetical protein